MTIQASFDRLALISDGIGTFEHADLVEPRRSEGYCTDDMARVVVVVTREVEPTPTAIALGRLAFRFLAEAQGVSGRVRNRRREGGRWLDRRGVEDCWGRSVWAFGSAARHAPDDWMRQSAMSYFDRGAQQRSPWPRSMAFAALGAAEVLAVVPRHDPARRLLADTVSAIGPLGAGDDWPWPEPRLRYANAALPEALIAAGELLERPTVRDDGLSLLRWLLDRETIDGHYSPTGVGGAGPDDHSPGFDQQPIEAAAMADACARALQSTGNDEWRHGIELAAAWFGGANDAGAVMWDAQTGGCYDGLERTAVNRNQGTESTLALIATMQRAAQPDPRRSVMSDPLATRLSLRLAPMPSRVVAQLFVPGHALGDGTDGRASRVVDDVVSMDDSDVATVLETITGRFAARHRDLDATLRHHAERLANRLAPGCELSAQRKLLLGATFTHEYSVEAAALCNPSAVVAPDQSDLRPGTVRFVLSVRQIGEGHRSSIGFRTGILDNEGAVSIEDPGPFATAGTIEETILDATTFQAATDHRDASQWLLARLGPRFTPSDLAARLHQLRAQSDTRRDVPATVRRLRQLADRHYRVSFPPSSRLDERVLNPATEAESNGLEDARFVRFVDLDGTVAYYATYTAYNGSAIVQQLLATTDFVTFTSTPLLGPAAANKGLALFPRRIGGRFYAMSRFDGATNAVTCSNDLGVWTDAATLDVDISGWQLVQVGNCGSPIELDEGWLVLTHGVGPLRTYSIGALLLDLDDPSVVIGQSRQPLLTPQRDEQDGYVPNVVYSCGSLRHGDVLLVPFGIADANVGFATFSIDDIVAAMDAPAPQQPRHNTERRTDA